MPTHTFTRYERAITKLAITTPDKPDIWRDIYWIGNLPEIPAGSVIHCHLRKQMENPSEFPSAIALLRTFYIRKPGGAEIDINLGNRHEVYPGLNGQLGLNITRDGHYESTDESTFYTVTETLPAGCRIAYKARAKTSTIGGYYMQVMDKGCFTVRIEMPDTLQAQIDALAARIAALE